MVLAATFPQQGLWSLAKNCSMGLKSGLYEGKVAQLGAGGLDGFADAGDFVAGEIAVHHNDIALAP